jgi:thioredoxin-dependent peroxiredoxin
VLKPGDRAPDFTLKADDGKDVSPRDYSGKRVILFFFPKANTPG